jgi:spore maturation protein CgeB
VEGLVVDKESIVIEDDLMRFKEIIRDLLADEKKRETLADKAYAEVKAKYDWRKYADRLDAVYQSAIS